MKRTRRLILGLLVVSLAMACQKEKGEAVLMVKMVDSPADFDSVIVEIVNVQIHYSQGNSSSSGWVDLTTNVGTYDLLELQNEVSAVLADPNEIPVGKLQQLRLILGDNNYAVEDSIIHPLELSSQDKNGIKINLKSTIEPLDSIEILLDFNAMHSIVEKGNGEYQLKPVIKLEEVIYYKVLV